MKPGIIPQRTHIANVLDRAIEALNECKARGDFLVALGRLVEDLQETRDSLGVSEVEAERSVV